MTNAAWAPDQVGVSGRALLMRRARAIVGASDAEDIVQETFERALRSRTFRPGSNPHPWIYRIARNVAFDALRWRTRFETFGELRSNEESAECTVLRREATFEIGVALRVLSEAQRRAIVLHDLEGYSSGEIASLDGVSINTVRRRIFRARRKLRETFAPMQP